MAKATNNKAKKMAAKNARRAAEAARKANAKPLMSKSNDKVPAGVRVVADYDRSINFITSLANELIVNDPKQSYESKPAMARVANELLNIMRSKAPESFVYEAALDLREQYEAKLRAKYNKLTVTTGFDQMISAEWDVAMAMAGVSQLEQVISGIIDSVIGTLASKHAPNVHNVDAGNGLMMTMVTR